MTRVSATDAIYEPLVLEKITSFKVGYVRIALRWLRSKEAVYT